MNLNRLHRLLPISVLLTAFALLSVGTPALAHDDLVSTSPSQGSVVEAGIVDLELEFSAELMTIGESAEIIVLGPEGELLNNGCAVIDGRLLSTKVDLDQAGNHTISWRVVSSDGHPIEGSFELEVTNDTGHVSAGLVPGTECDWATSELGETPGAEASGADGWVYWLLWLLIPAVGIGLYFWLRPRPKASA